MADVLSMIANLAGADNPIAKAFGSLTGRLIDLIPDDKAKEQARQAAEIQMTEMQIDLRKAELQAQTEQVKAAQESAKNDHYLWGARAYFCYGMTTLYFWMYGVAPFVFHRGLPDVPISLHTMFAVIMLGFVGVPAGIEAVKQIMTMPGESKVSAFGISAANNDGRKVS